MLLQTAPIAVGRHCALVFVLLRVLVLILTAFIPVYCLDEQDQLVDVRPPELFAQGGNGQLVGQYVSTRQSKP